MVNTILTVSQITRKALMILHQKCNFIGTIDKQYDDSFGKEGAKIGDTLRIRLPNRYVTRNTVALSTQDTVEQSVNLTVSRRLGVDVSFTSAELTLSLDDFSSRILEPAMAVLAAGLEADAMSMLNSVYNQVTNVGNPFTFSRVLQGRKILTDNLTPNSQRTANLNTQDNVDLVDAVKGLFQDSKNIAEQYREGLMGRTAGFDFYENTIWPRRTEGTHNTAYLTNGATQTGSTIAVDTGTGTIKAGDVFTVAGVFMVHPETKAVTNVLQQFTVTTDYAGGNGNISITPAVVASGALQNVNQALPDNSAISFAVAASTAYGVSLGYHKSAFTFATADLIMPNGVDFKSRQVYDGISMRIIRAYDINNDAFPCRIDVHYGYVAQRPQLAVRYANN